MEILKQGINSVNPGVYDKAVLAVSEFINNKFFEQADVDILQPQTAAIKSLGGKRESEGEMMQRVRKISAINVLAYLDDMNYK